MTTQSFLKRAATLWRTPSPTMLVTDGRVSCPRKAVGDVDVDGCLSCPFLIASERDDAGGQWIRCKSPRPARVTQLQC